MCQGSENNTVVYARAKESSEYIWMSMAKSASTMPEYASAYINAPQYAWTWLNIAQCLSMWLNIAECSWLCLKMHLETVLTMSGFSVCVIILDIWQGFKCASGIKYARVLNMPRYIYNKIIIILTNAIILEFCLLNLYIQTVHN